MFVFARSDIDVPFSKVNLKINLFFNSSLVASKVLLVNIEVNRAEK